MSYYFSSPLGDPHWLIYMQAQSNSPQWFRRQSSTTCCAAMHARLKRDRSPRHWRSLQTMCQTRRGNQWFHWPWDTLSLSQPQDIMGGQLPNNKDTHLFFKRGRSLIIEWKHVCIPFMNLQAVYHSVGPEDSVLFLCHFWVSLYNTK